MERGSLAYFACLALALGAGALMAMQPAINARLNSFCSHRLQASVISFGVGFVSLVLLSLILRTGFPALRSLTEAPWWAWTGGLCGAYMVTVSLSVAPKLGATRWFVLVLAGQFTLSLVLDHFGWLGFERTPLSWQRVLWTACIVLGVLGVMNTK